MEHKTRTKALSWLLSLALMLSLLPGLSGTARAVSGTEWNGNQTVSADSSAEYVYLTADVTLTIETGVTLTVNGGIDASGHTLTVTGKGSLVVTGANRRESGESTDGLAGGDGITGNLVVKGTKITVTGGNGGKGGSGGTAGNGGAGGNGVNGNVTVNDGSVFMSGGSGGAGGTSYGGGSGGSNGNAGAAITGTITGGDAKESDDNSNWFAISETTSTKRYVKVVAAASPAHTHGDITFAAWDSTDSLPTEANSYYLTQDVTISSTWNVPTGTTNLCLNGHGIRYSGDGNASVITVGSGATLNLYDCDTTTEHYITLTDGRGTAVSSSGTPSNTCIKVTGGYITGGTGTTSDRYGGGVYVKAGTFTMYGGTIIGNTATRGGGVGINYSATPISVFNMEGGTIENNTAVTYGGGVFNFGSTFNMKGGMINNNTANGSTYGYGGGVSNSAGTFNMSGGTIKNNSANLFGGVRHDSGTFNLSGNPIIKDNLSDSKTNNVYLSDGKVINVTGALADTARVGVSMQTPGVFTSSGETKAKDYLANFTSDDSTYAVKVDGDELKLELAHNHNFTYSANGATITATCSADGCPLTNKKATLTIAAPLHTNVNDGQSAEATITDASSIKGSATVSYYAATKSGTTYTKTGSALGSAPDAAGNYVAEITVGGVTAFVGYTIKAVGGTATAVTEADIVQILSNLVEIKGKEGQEYIIVPKDTTPTEEHWRYATLYCAPYNVDLRSVSPDVNLTPITEYDIYTRVAETETATAGSAAAKMTVMTCLEEMGVTSNDGLTGLVGATYTVTTTPAAAENGVTFQWYYYNGPIEFGTTPDSITEITGATNNTYTLPESDVGKYFGVKAFKNGKEVGAIWLTNPVKYGTVTYDAKGGTPTPDSVSNLKFGDKLTQPANPTRSGYSFAGWYMEEDYKTAWGFASDIVDVAEITLYAKWSAVPLHTITGTVKDSTGATPQSGVTVTLARGDTVLAKTVTDSSGNFTFSAETGTYNIIAEKGGQTKTELVELTANQNLTITMPEAGKNSVLDNDNAGNYAATVGGLDEIAAAAETVSGGSTVTIMLTITAEVNVSEGEKAQFNTEKAAIQTVAAGKTLECLDLTLQKVVTGTGAGTTDIGGSNTQLLTIIIPYAASGKQNITVYRYHGTTAEAMTQDPAPGEEGFVVGTDSITIYAKGFSTYAIGYTTPTYSGGGSSGGSSGSTITVPVSGDSASVSVSASVSGTTATVKAPTTAQLDKVIGESVKTGDVTIDVSGLNKDIATVSIPTETVKAIEKAVSDPDNDAIALTVKLTDGSVTFDAKALAAVAQQAKGSTIQLNLDNIGESKLKSAQKTAIRDLDVQAVYDAYLTSNGQRISDFKGGKATVTVSYVLKDGQTGRGVVVWYVAEDGKTTEVPTTYTSKEVTFTIEHFSNYVIVYDAARAAACPQDNTCPISAFTDADPTAWYHDGVHYALENGIMSGYGNGKFGPGDTTSRAMMAQILYNMEGKPAIRSGMPFADVTESDWYAAAVSWAESKGYVTGYANPSGTGMIFAPNDPVTREQLVTILYRYAQYKGVDVSVGENTNILSYDDAFSVSDWAMSAMQWACGSGVVTGKTASTLNPKDAATRAEIATIIMRYSESGK